MTVRERKDECLCKSLPHGLYTSGINGGHIFIHEYGVDSDFVSESSPVLNYIDVVIAPNPTQRFKPWYAA